MVFVWILLGLVVGVIGGIVLYSVTEKHLTLEDLKVAQALAKLMGEL